MTFSVTPSLSTFVAWILYILVFLAVAAAIVTIVVIIAKYNKKISGNRGKFMCPKCGTFGTGGVCNKCGFRYFQNNRSQIR